MKKIILFILLSLNILANELNSVDCVILKDENSIVCKYIHKRVDFDKTVVFNWIEPSGKITRSRDMLIPTGHGSVYDYRYTNGRTKGAWTLEVNDNNIIYKTNFIIE